MSILSTLKSATKAIASNAIQRMRSESGSAVEAVIVLPPLIAIYAGSFVFFDAARTDTLAMKATYTVSDILSREEEVDEPFLEGLSDMMAFLVPTNAEPKLRVSLITFNDDHASGSNYQLIWSYPSANSDMGKLTQAMVEADTDWIPIMGDDESVVVTEAYIRYDPIFDMGWATPSVFKHVMVTRPRFAPTLTKTDEPEGPNGTDDIDNEGSENSVSGS